MSNFIFAFFLIITCFTVNADDRVEDSNIGMVLAILRIDLKKTIPGKSDVWWISHRKCMVDTANIFFKKDRLLNLAVKLDIQGRQAVLSDPDLSRLINIIDYCKKTSDSNIGR